jgi:hypothetical protein
MKIDKDYKIRVTPEQSERIQRICFDRGIVWAFDDDVVRYTQEPHLYITDGVLAHGDDDADFDENPDQLITAEEFIAKFGDGEMSQKDVKSPDAYTRIIDWLYTNDGKFGSKQEWRKAFVKFLKEVLE